MQVVLIAQHWYPKLLSVANHEYIISSHLPNHYINTQYKTFVERNFAIFLQILSSVILKDLETKNRCIMKIKRYLILHSHISKFHMFRVKWKSWIIPKQSRFSIFINRYTYSLKIQSLSGIRCQIRYHLHSARLPFEIR